MSSSVGAMGVSSARDERRSRRSSAQASSRAASSGDLEVPQEPKKEESPASRRALALRVAAVRLLHDAVESREMSLSNHDRVGVLDLLVPMFDASSRLLRLAVFACFRAAFASCSAPQRRAVAQRMLPLLRARAPHCLYSEGALDLLAAC